MAIDEALIAKKCGLFSPQCIKIILVVVVTTVYTMSTILVAIIVAIAPTVLSNHTHVYRSEINGNGDVFNSSYSLSDSGVLNYTINPLEDEPPIRHKPVDNSIKLGFLFGMRGLVQLIVNPFFGYLIDRTLPLCTIMIAIVLDFASNLVYGFAKNYTMFMIARILNAMACSAAGCGTYSALSDYFPSDSDRRRILGVLHIFIFFGVSFGPPYGGFVFQFIGQFYVFLFLMPVWIAAVLLSIPVWRYEWHSRGVKKAKKVLRESKKSSRKISLPSVYDVDIINAQENPSAIEEEESPEIEAKPEKQDQDKKNVDQQNSPSPAKKLVEVEELLTSKHSLTSNSHIENIMKKPSNRKSRGSMNSLKEIEVRLQNRRMSTSRKSVNSEMLIASSALTIATLKPVPIFRLISDPYILIGGLGISINSLGIFGLVPTLSVYMREKFDAQEYEQGVVWITGVAFHFLGTLFAGFFCHRWPTKIHYLIMCCISISGVACFSVLYCNKWYYIFLPIGINFFDIAIGEYCLIPFLSTLVDVRHSSVYGSISAIIMASISLSSCLGAFVSGPIVQTFGFYNFILSVSIVMVAYTPLLLFTHRYWI